MKLNEKSKSHHRIDQQHLLGPVLKFTILSLPSLITYISFSDFDFGIVHIANLGKEFIVSSALVSYTTKWGHTSGTWGIWSCIGSLNHGPFRPPIFFDYAGYFVWFLIVTTLVLATLGVQCEWLFVCTLIWHRVPKNVCLLVARSLRPPKKTSCPSDASSLYALLLLLLCVWWFMHRTISLSSRLRKFTHKQTLRCFTNRIDFILAIIIPFQTWFLCVSIARSLACFLLFLRLMNDHCFCHTQIDTRRSWWLRGGGRMGEEEES